VRVEPLQLGPIHPRHQPLALSPSLELTGISNMDQELYKRKFAQDGQGHKIFYFMLFHVSVSLILCLLNLVTTFFFTL